MERDPRKDPMAGDVVFAGPQRQIDRYTVGIREGDRVGYFISGTPLFCTLTQWQEWMAGAEVLHIASPTEAAR